VPFICECYFCTFLSFCIAIGIFKCTNPQSVVLAFRQVQVEQLHRGVNACQAIAKNAQDAVRSREVSTIEKLLQKTLIK